MIHGDEGHVFRVRERGRVQPRHARAWNQRDAVALLHRETGMDVVDVMGVEIVRVARCWETSPSLSNALGEVLYPHEPCVRRMRHEGKHRTVSGTRWGAR